MYNADCLTGVIPMLVFPVSGYDQNFSKVEGLDSLKMMRMYRNM